MKDLGLVFSGGGGKGPYQIGVWRFLRESGLEGRVGCVSGTSIGSLNAALFCGGDLEAVTQMWKEIEPGEVLTAKKINPLQVAGWGAVGLGLLGAPLLDPLGIGTAAAALTLSQAATLLFKAQGSVFTQQGIRNKIALGVDPEKLANSPIPCFATCLNVGIPPRADRFDLRNYSIEDVTTILLASEAIPGVFPPVKFNGATYCDGGFTKFGDNVPVKPVYDAGFRKILVLHLSYDDEKTDLSQYPGAEIIDLIPSQDLGNLVNGTMDFSGKGARWRISLGYEDAQRELAPLAAKLLTESTEA